MVANASGQRAARWSCLVFLLVALPAAAQLTTAVTTNVGVDATAVNPSSSDPGVSRNTSGNGPLADAASALFGPNTADGAASVGAGGLHASSAVHVGTTVGYTATARGFTGLVDPFILVPHAGFVGTQALIRIPYSFAGSITLHPSLAECSTCFGAVQADLGVDGMPDQLHFLGVSSQGTMMNANFIAGGVARSGVLEGLVPVNTELFLRAGLLSQVHCQAFDVACGTDSLASLSFAAFSPDAVDFVWGLEPTAIAAVPEPSTWLLLAAGVAGIARLRKDRRGRD